jgi:hypothetical protein
MLLYALHRGLQILLILPRNVMAVGGSLFSRISQRYQQADNSP